MSKFRKGVRHGNPTNPGRVATVGDTMFDRMIERRGLSRRPEAWSWDDGVRQFVRRFGNTHYVPEWLLVAIGERQNAGDDVG